MSASHFHKNSFAGITKRIFFFCLTIMASIPAFAQQKKEAGKDSITHLHLHAAAKAYNDSIVIRWAPGNAVAWQMCNDSGYSVTRVDYSDPQHPITTLLTPQPIKPMTLAQMKAHLARDNKYAAIAAQAMYGNDFRMTKAPPTSFADKINQARNAMNFRFSFAMHAADFSAPVASTLALRWVDKKVKTGGRYLYKISSTAGNKIYTVDSVGVFVLNIKEKKQPVPQGLTAFGFDRKVELHWNRRQLGGFDAYYIQRSDDGGKTYHVLNKLPFSASYSPPSPTKNKKADTLLHKMASILRDHQVYFDSIPQDYKMYYYRVSGLNAFAEQSPYSKAIAVQGRDLTPPPAPVIDTVANISGHTIKLKWTQKKASPDLAGYYINRANSVKGPFLPLTKNLLSKNVASFIDTSAVPHKPNYYAVIAVDTAKNISASIPRVGYITDTIPPTAPTGLAGTIDSNGMVHLHWNKNIEPDIKGYKVYYSYNPDYQFSQITHTSIPENQYTDSIPMNTLNRKVYYKVVAVDRNNNHSAYSAFATLKKPIVIPPSTPVAGDVYADKKGAHIQWFESRSLGAVGYQIYRKGKDTDWQPLVKLNQDWSVTSLHFTDSTIKSNIDYYYSAETIDSTGIHSKRSFAVHVRDNEAISLPALDNLQAVLDTTNYSVKLSWKYSGEGNYFFIIYRATKSGTLAPWHSYDKTTLSCEDNRVTNGTYQYAIKVVNRDKDIGSSLSKPVSVNVYVP